MDHVDLLQAQIAERKAHLEKLKSSKEQAATPEEKTAVEEELERTQQHLDELSTKLAEAEEADDSDWTSVSSDEPDTEEYTVNPHSNVFYFPNPNKPGEILAVKPDPLFPNDVSKFKWGKVGGIYPFIKVHRTDGSVRYEPGAHHINAPGVKESLNRCMNENPAWKDALPIIEQMGPLTEDPLWAPILPHLDP